MDWEDVLPEDKTFIITDEIKECLKDLDEGKNVFIRGNAGTGKTELLKHWITRTNKNVIVLAPTGIAALNSGGMTIHSFFKFPVPIWKMTNWNKYDDLYSSIDAIIIDEVSMVRSDTFDYIDKFLKINGPNKGKLMGGCQMIVVGDFYQLPPILSNNEAEIFYEKYDNPFVFTAPSWKQCEFNQHNLTKIFRQKDKEFIGFLNRVRSNSLTQDDYSYLQKRVTKEINFDDTVVLACTNKVVNYINKGKLNELPGRLFCFNAKVSGTAINKRDNFPVPPELELKIGAKIIMILNDPMKRWVNGTMGKILDINEMNKSIFVELEDGNKSWVNRHIFKDVKFVKADEKITFEEVGTFEQFPLKLAWSITVHKSQGLSFDKVFLDLTYMPFTHGQFYVAVSRCRSYEGLYLSEIVSKNSIICDTSVKKFFNNE